MEVLIDGVRYVPAEGPPTVAPPVVAPPERPGQLSPNFNRSEFVCRHCGALPSGMPPPRLVEVLQAIRDHFNAPVTINSGHRCKTHNANVGGSTNSRHITGDAADIVVRGVAPRDVHAFAESLLAGTGGLGLYNTFVHVDVRPGTPARWNG